MLHNHNSLSLNHLTLEIHLYNTSPHLKTWLCPISLHGKVCTDILCKDIRKWKSSSLASGFNLEYSWIVIEARGTSSWTSTTTLPSFDHAGVTGKSHCMHLNTWKFTQKNKMFHNLSFYNVQCNTTIAYNAATHITSCCQLPMANDQSLEFFRGLK